MLYLLILLTALSVTLSLDYTVQTPPLTTDWTYKVGSNPWTQYPRPQMVRDRWKSLNGIWSYRQAKGLEELQDPPTGELDRAVMIPSCIESGLSGIMVPLDGSGVYSWFRTTFEVPEDWRGDDVIINFGAVDYEATVFVNGHNATFHRGGYSRFWVDITAYLNVNGQNELVVFVRDPTDSEGEVIPRESLGKQTLKPSHIFYTPCSGIWQSVFIEPVPKKHIERVDVSADKHGKVEMLVHFIGEPTTVDVDIMDGDEVIAQGSGRSGETFCLKVDTPRLWSPTSPDLYNITIKAGHDAIRTYTGFRTIERGKVDGVTRPLLNGEFIFTFGPLDQGYWPDGLYTPPSYDAMLYDLKLVKDLGFNMIRKHVKVEMDLFYRACDEIGLLVIQDMPNLRLEQPDAEQQEEFERQLEEMISLHKSFPSIYTWTIYNEGWGQLDSAPEVKLAEKVRRWDPSRLIDASSGWHDHGAGDYHDNHHYSDPQCGTPFYSTPGTPYDKARIGFQGEFGGVGHNVSIEHLWNVQQAIDGIDETYELDADIETWNYRSHVLLGTLRDQVDKYACSGGVWTQTADVEGEVNGLVTYDRRVVRVDRNQWRKDIQALYDAAEKRARGGVPMGADLGQMRFAGPAQRDVGA